MNGRKYTGRCAGEGCTGTVHARGFCPRCYRSWRKLAGLIVRDHRAEHARRPSRRKVPGGAPT